MKKPVPGICCDVWYRRNGLYRTILLVYCLREKEQLYLIGMKWVGAALGACSDLMAGILCRNVAIGDGGPSAVEIGAIGFVHFCSQRQPWLEISCWSCVSHIGS